VWRARASVCPGVARARKHLGIGKALGGDDALKRVEPMMIVSLAGIGIAGSLRLFDLVAEHGRPFGPGKDAALVQR
jgi:hypothetical protein